MKLDLLSSASLIALGTAMTLLSSGAAIAGSTMDAASLGATLTDFTGDALAINQFNPSAGQQLTSVVITEGGSYNSTGSLTNNSASQQSFTFKLGMTMSLFASSTAPGSFPSLTINSSGAPATAYTLNPGATGAFSTTKTITSNTQTLTTGLGAYEGSGTFDVLFSSKTDETFSGGGGNITTSLTTYADPTVTVTYNFSSPVVSTPEPASLALLGGCVAGLGVIRRRRKA